MENIFFDTNYTTLIDMLIKLSAFFVVSGLLIYLIYFTLTKLLFRKSKDRKEINLRLVFLWSLLTYLIVFNIYLFILFYKNGIDFLNFLSLNVYLGIIAQLSIYVCLITYFFIKRHSLKKLINEKSIN